MKKIGFLLLTFLLITFTQANAAGINMDSVKREAVKASEEVYKAKKDSAILSKLNPEQLMKIKEQEIQLERKRIDSEDHSEMPLSSAAVVLICLIPFLFVLLVLGINGYIKNRDSKRRYDLYMKSLEMGQAIPDHFFNEPKVEKKIVSNLKKGVLWLAVGIGVIVSFLLMKEKDALFLGIIPSCIGIAYLLVHSLEKPKKDLAEQGNE